MAKAKRISDWVDDSENMGEVPVVQDGVYRLKCAVPVPFTVDGRVRDRWPNADAEEGMLFHVSQSRDMHNMPFRKSWPELYPVAGDGGLRLGINAITPAKRWFWVLVPHLERLPEDCWGQWAFANLGDARNGTSACILERLMLDGVLTPQQVLDAHTKVEAEGEDGSYVRFTARFGSGGLL
jgi:hypothetical protein